jgi:hypothetical protein
MRPKRICRTFRPTSVVKTQRRSSPWSNRGRRLIASERRWLLLTRRRGGIGALGAHGRPGDSALGALSSGGVRGLRSDKKVIRCRVMARLHTGGDADNASLNATLSAKNLVTRTVLKPCHRCNEPLSLSHYGLLDVANYYHHNTPVGSQVAFTRTNFFLLFLLASHPCGPS